MFSNINGTLKPTFQLGKADSTDKELLVSVVGLATFPSIKWIASSSTWAWSNDGVTWLPISSVSSVRDTLIAGEEIFAGDPVSISSSGLAIRANASVAGRQDVYGIAAIHTLASSYATLTVTGIHTHTGAIGWPIGTILFLKEGGGWHNLPPDPNGAAGVRISTLGQVLSTSSIMVRVQVVATT